MTDYIDHETPIERGAEVVYRRYDQVNTLTAPDIARAAHDEKGVLSPAPTLDREALDAIKAAFITVLSRLGDDELRSLVLDFYATPRADRIKQGDA